MPFDWHHQWITGVMLGIEFESCEAADVLVLDLLILRLTFYIWKDPDDFAFA